MPGKKKIENWEGKLNMLKTSIGTKNVLIKRIIKEVLRNEMSRKKKSTMVY